MGQEEYGRNQPGIDVFVDEFEVHPSYTIDDDNQPLDATIILEVLRHHASQRDPRPVRLHFPVSAAPRLAEIVRRVADEAAANAEADRRP